LVGTLSVLPAGGRNSGARLLFRTSAAKRLVEEMRETYDVTLIDLPPLMSAQNEAAALCDWSDGTIMVVRANATKASALAKAVAMIDSHKLLGVVLNQEQEDLPRWLQRLV
jgi:Mrp family chromosome partitioning ATPase